MIHADVVAFRASNRGRVTFVAVAILLLVGAVIATGLVGVLIVAFSLMMWVVLGTPAGIATVAMLLVAATAAPPDPLQVVGVSLALAAIGVGAHVVEAHRLALVGGVAIVALAVGTVAILALAVWPLWAVSGLVLGLLGLIAYILHRVHLLRLGLIEGVSTGE